MMSNRYHLAIETLQANWVKGMTGLQATFALRFNRFRKETVHLFQDRSKSFESSDWHDGEAMKLKRICAKCNRANAQLLVLEICSNLFPSLQELET